MILNPLQPVSTAPAIDPDPVSRLQEDLAYTVNWSRVYDTYFIYNTVYDFNSDGVNDVLRISFRDTWFSDIEVIDAVYNKTLMKYLNTGNTYLYSLIIPGDINSNGYPEIACVYVNNTILEIVLLEPATNTVLYKRTHNVDLQGYIYPLTLNHVYVNNTLEFMVAAIKNGFQPKLLSYLFTVDISTGDLLDVAVIEDKFYVLWSNLFIVDSDGDGLLDTQLTTPVVSAYIALSNLGGITGVVEVRDMGGEWSWSTSREDCIPLTIIVPYSREWELVTVVYSHVDKTGSIDSYLIETYGMYNGTRLYGVTYSLDTYNVYSLILLGESLGVLVLDKMEGSIEVHVYDTCSGVLETSIVVEETGDEVPASGTSIGDLCRDGDIDMLIGVKNRLYLVSTSGYIDYLGTMTGDIILYPSSTVLYNTSRLHLVETEITGEQYGFYAVSLVENTTETVEIAIVEPVNNTLTKTPFRVTAKTSKPVSSITLEVYCEGKLVLAKEMDYMGNNTYTATIEYLDDGVYSLVARTSYNTSEPIIVAVDNTPPKIVISKPLNNSVVRDRIELVVTVKDQSLYMVKVAVDTEIYRSISGDELGEYMATPKLLVYNTTINVSRLTDGVHTLNVTACDLLGRCSSVSIVFQKDTKPPAVDIEAPTQKLDSLYIAGKKYLVEKYPVTIRAYDENGVDKVVAYINGYNRTVYLNESGYGLLELELEPGYNNVTVVAYDVVGNSIAKTITVYLNTIDPVVDVKSIEQRGQGIYFKIACSTESIVPLSRIVVTVYSRLDTGLVEVARKEYSVREKSVVVEDYVEVPSDGYYVVKVYVEDLSGNNNTLCREVVVDTQPPQVSIVSVVVEKTRVTINWAVVDEHTNVTEVMLVIDNTKVIDVTGLNTYKISLSPGEHVIAVKAIDERGNIGEDSVKVYVEHPLELFMRKYMWLAATVLVLVILSLVTMVKLRT